MVLDRIEDIEARLRKLENLPEIADLFRRQAEKTKTPAVSEPKPEPKPEPVSDY